MTAAEFVESLPWRIPAIEKDVADLKTAVKPVPVLESKVEGLEGAVHELNDSVKSLRTAIVGFALTVAGSSVAVLIGLMVIR